MHATFILGLVLIAIIAPTISARPWWRGQGGKRLGQGRQQQFRPNNQWYQPQDHQGFQGQQQQYRPNKQWMQQQDPEAMQEMRERMQEEAEEEAERAAELREQQQEAEMEQYRQQYAQQMREYDAEAAQEMREREAEAAEEAREAEAERMEMEAERAQMMQQWQDMNALREQEAEAAEAEAEEAEALQEQEGEAAEMEQEEAEALREQEEEAAEAAEELREQEAEAAEEAAEAAEGGEGLGGEGGEGYGGEGGMGLGGEGGEGFGGEGGEGFGGEGGEGLGGAGGSIGMSFSAGSPMGSASFYDQMGGMYGQSVSSVGTSFGGSSYGGYQGSFGGANAGPGGPMGGAGGTGGATNGLPGGAMGGAGGRGGANNGLPGGPNGGSTGTGGATNGGAGGATGGTGEAIPGAIPGGGNIGANGQPSGAAPNGAANGVPPSGGQPNGPVNGVPASRPGPSVAGANGAKNATGGAGPNKPSGNGTSGAGTTGAKPNGTDTSGVGLNGNVPNGAKPGGAGNGGATGSAGGAQGSSQWQSSSGIGGFGPSMGNSFPDTTNFGTVNEPNIPIAPAPFAQAPEVPMTPAETAAQDSAYMDKHLCGGFLGANGLSGKKALAVLALDYAGMKQALEPCNVPSNGRTTRRRPVNIAYRGAMETYGQDPASAVLGDLPGMIQRYGQTPLKVHLFSWYMPSEHALRSLLLKKSRGGLVNVDVVLGYVEESKMALFSALLGDTTFTNLLQQLQQAGINVTRLCDTCKQIANMTRMERARQGLVNGVGVFDQQSGQCGPVADVPAADQLPLNTPQCQSFQESMGSCLFGKLTEACPWLRQAQAAAEHPLAAIMETWSKECGKNLSCWQQKGGYLSFLARSAASCHISQYAASTALGQCAGAGQHVPLDAAPTEPPM